MSLGTADWPSSDKTEEKGKDENMLHPYGAFEVAIHRKFFPVLGR